MSWIVRLEDAFDPEFDDLPTGVQDELLAHAHLREEFDPMLGRPWVDTLNGARHANMKELRFTVAGGLVRSLCVRSRTKSGPARGGQQVRYQ